MTVPIVEPFFRIRVEWSLQSDMKLRAVAFLLFASCKVGAPQESLFRPAMVIPLPNKPSNVGLADLNKDGRLDLIVVSDEARTSCQNRER